MADKKMGLFRSGLTLNLILIITAFGQVLTAYTDWIMMLWVRDGVNETPSAIWQNSSSSYNGNVNMTSTLLIGNSTVGYRNMLIDNWASHPPDIIRVSYRNADGVPIFSADFYSSLLNRTEWFATRNAITGISPNMNCTIKKTFTRYSLDFCVSDNTWGVDRYKATTLTLNNGSLHLLVASGDSPPLLRSSPVTNNCYASFGGLNPLLVNATVVNLSHEYCSAFCRERNYTYAAVHSNTSCSCLVSAPAGGQLNACTVPCEGNSLQMCGGSVPPAIPFVSIVTDIDTSRFGVPLSLKEAISLTGTAEFSYPSSRHVYGFNISVPAMYLPTTIKMELVYRNGKCNESNHSNRTLEKTFTITASVVFYLLEIEPILLQCITVSLFNGASSNLLTFPVTMTTIAIEDGNFVSASILSIEAAWKSEPAVDTDDLCECDCWVYNLLYGDSPYNNLTYQQIEQALKNITEKIQKELTVNTSTLSSTIRKLTSANDKRPSAAAVGYVLGVALLVASIGAILLADFPKMLTHMNILRKNLVSIFCPRSDNQAENLLRMSKSNKVKHREI